MYKDKNNDNDLTFKISILFNGGLTRFISPTPFLVELAPREGGMDEAVLLDDVLHVRTCHAVDRLAHVNLGGHHDGTGHEEYCAPNVMHTKENLQKN